MTTATAGSSFALLAGSISLPKVAADAVTKTNHSKAMVNRFNCCRECPGHCAKATEELVAGVTHQNLQPRESIPGLWWQRGIAARIGDLWNFTIVIFCPQVFCSLEAISDQPARMLSGARSNHALRNAQAKRRPARPPASAPVALPQAAPQK